MAQGAEEKAARAKKRREDRYIQDWHARAYGQEVPGGTYKHALWGDEYTVVSMWCDLSGAWRRQPSRRVRYAGGEEREHCTNWSDGEWPDDPSRSFVVRQPDGYEGVPLADRYAADRASRSRSRAARD